VTYSKDDVSAATLAIEKYRRHDDTSVVGAALAVVGLSSERAAKEARIRNDMIRIAHNSGASLRELGEATGLGRRAVTAIVREVGRKV
jgi:hypothetical protein